MEYNAKNVGGWKLRGCNSICYAQPKQWEFMHFENFPYSFKHLIQINGQMAKRFRQTIAKWVSSSWRLDGYCRGADSQGQWQARGYYHHQTRFNFGGIQCSYCSFNRARAQAFSALESFNRCRVQGLMETEEPPLADYKRKSIQTCTKLVCTQLYECISIVFCKI